MLTADGRIDIEATWCLCQDILATCRGLDPARRKTVMQPLIATVGNGVPNTLIVVKKLGRSLNKRALDVPAYFDRSGTSNGSTKAIDGPLEHLHVSAFGFRNLTH